MNEDRIVKVVTFAKTSELLNEGEAKPKKADLNVFVSARATKIAEKECKLLMKSFAKQCDVIAARGKAAERHGRYHSFAIILAFVEKADFGSFNKEHVLRLNEVKINPLSVNNENTREKESSVTRLPNVRMSIYKSIERGCRTLRRREGNCSITSVDIYSQARVDGGAARTSAQAELAFLSEANN